MELLTLWSAAALALALPVMVSAARADWKQREIPDRHWAGLGLGGVLLFLLYACAAGGFRWEYLAGAMIAVLCLAAVLVDSNAVGGTAAVLILALLALLLLDGRRDACFWAYLAIPVLTVVYVTFYLTGLVRGGGDAKCLIALTLVFPLYPAFGPLPLLTAPALVEGIFVFSLSVLFTAALGTVLFCLANGWRNRNAPESWFRRLTGRRLPLEEAERAFVWPVEDVRNGQIVPVGACGDDELPDVNQRLRAAGAETVYVTPMIPFVVPLAIAVPFVALVGSPLFLLTLL